MDYREKTKAANSFTKFVREVLARLKAFFEKIIGKKSVAEESQIMAKQAELKSIWEKTKSLEKRISLHGNCYV